MATTSPWKNLRRAFRPRVGTCLSAASSKSVATRDTSAPSGRFIPKETACVDIKLMDSVADEVYGASAKIEEAALSAVAGFRGRKRRDLASCRFHPATLMMHKRSQYESKAGRLHLFSPSTIRKITQSQGSRLPKHQRAQRPIRPPIIRRLPM